MIKASKRLRETIVSPLVKHFPGMLHILAGKEARRRLGLDVRSGWIDIVDESGARRIRLGRRNAVYTLDMMNCFEYYFGSAASIPLKCGRNHYQLVDFSTPRFQAVTGFADFPIMCPSLTEPYATAQQYLDFAKLEAGHVAIDLGAYSALTSIAFSKAVGSTGRVIALEPDPGNFHSCTINLAYHATINRLQNVTLLQAAVGSRKEILSFSAEGAMGSSEVDIVGSYRGDVVQVEALPLSEIAAKYGLGRVDFIKMDIEGAEEKVIAAARDMFDKFRPKIIIEPHLVNGEMSTVPIMRLLEDYGYSCEVIGQNGVDVPLVTGTPI